MKVKEVAKVKSESGDIDEDEAISEDDVKKITLTKPAKKYAVKEANKSVEDSSEMEIFYSFKLAVSRDLILIHRKV